MDFLNNMYSAYKTATTMLGSASTGTQQTNFSGVEMPGAPKIEGTPSLDNGYNAFDEETKRRQQAEAQLRQQMAMSGGMGGAGGIAAPAQQEMPAATGAVSPANYALTPTRLPNAASQMAAPQMAAPQMAASQMAAPQMAAPQMAAPQMAAPVVQQAAPQTDAFGRIIQAESRGRQTDSAGNVLTSPKGALGIAQVMPATAMQPGYGVADIFTMASQMGVPFADKSEASAKQLLANKDLNRQFGSAYFGAMNKVFGDEQKATAAYNAGAGRVQQAVQLAQQRGGQWTDYIPQETQNYLKQVAAYKQQQAAAQQAQATTQQAQATPAAPVAAVSPEQSQQAAQIAAQQQAAAQAQMGPQVSQMPANVPELQQWSMFHTAANSRDPNTIVRAIKEINDPYQKAELQSQLADIAGFERNKNNAQKAVQNAVTSGDPRELNKALTNKDWGKIALAYLASAFGMKELGRDLAAEGGLGEFNIYGETTLNDQSASIVSAPNGRTLRGVWTSGENMGKELTPAELQQTFGDLAGGGKITKPEVKQAVEYVGTDEKLKGQGGVVVTKMLRNGGTRTTVESNGKTYEYKASDWRSPKENEAMRRMDYQLITDLNKKHGTNVLDAEKDYVIINGPMSPEQRQEFRRVYGLRSGMMGGTGAVVGGEAPAAPVAGAGTQAPAAGGTPAAPAPAPALGGQSFKDASAAANAANIKVPLAQQQSKADAYKTQLKEEAEILGKDLGTTKVNQGRAEQNADYLTTKIDQVIKHPGFSVSVGASAQPGFQFIPGTDKASWYARFEEIKGQSFLQAIENLRGMGALSNLEGDTATKAIQRMSTSQSEDEFKKAATDFQNIIKRGIDRNRVKLGQEPKYGVQEESEIQKATEAPAGTTSSGNKFKRVQ